MSVWLTIPSARSAAEIEPLLLKWRERGYMIALWRDDDAPVLADLKITRKDVGYPGYAAAVNQLIRDVIGFDSGAEWFIAAGDDIEADPTYYADEIAAQCYDYFWSNPGSQFPQYEPPDNHAGLFGVMQPTGDRWHEGVGGFANAPIDRVAGSAWYGREYCRRMYGGRGPLFDGYQHMFVDEEAQEVAIKMGVFWQRRDLVQRHNHWGRGATDKAMVEMRPGLIPPHLEKWNTVEHWNGAKRLFQTRKAAGFPGHEPIP